MSSVGAREQEEIIHKSAKALPGLQHDVYRLPILCFRSMLTRERYLGFRTERRCWGAHLMGRISHKPTLLFERALHAVE
jgi:hypothetical protein